jgi:hypothetical protein
MEIKISRIFPSMDSTFISEFHFRRAQPFKYKIPRPKNATVHNTKITSLIRGSLNQPPAYSRTLRKR